MSTVDIGLTDLHNSTKFLINVVYNFFLKFLTQSVLSIVSAKSGTEMVYCTYYPPKSNLHGRIVIVWGYS